MHLQLLRQQFQSRSMKSDVLFVLYKNVWPRRLRPWPGSWCDGCFLTSNMDLIVRAAQTTVTAINIWGQETAVASTYCWSGHTSKIFLRHATCMTGIYRQELVYLERVPYTKFTWQPVYKLYETVWGILSVFYENACIFSLLKLTSLTCNYFLGADKSL